MADEAAATLTADVISYGIAQLTSVEVIRKIKECVSYNQQIELILDFPARDEYDYDENYERLRFDATVDMQNTICLNSRHIKKLTMYNDSGDKDEHDRCFTFCTRIVLEIIGNGMHLTYQSSYIALELQQANQLAEALRRSNNNNNNDNNAIEKFSFYAPRLKPVIFQLLWNALLDSSVRKIFIGNPDMNININIDFTGMNTNTTLTELELSGYNTRDEDCRNLFRAIKKNTGLEKLELNFYWDVLPQLKRWFEEMLCENITLLDCRFYRDEYKQVRIGGYGPLS